MRRAACLLPLLLVSACKDEPDFDSRYAKAAAEIEARAKAMDDDVLQAEADAPVAARDTKRREESAASKQE